MRSPFPRTIPGWTSEHAAKIVIGIVLDVTPYGPVTPRDPVSAIRHPLSAVCHLRSVLIYSKRCEQPTTALPTQADGAARSEFERAAHKESFAHLATALRPSRSIQQWVFHQAQTGIDNSPGPAL